MQFGKLLFSPDGRASQKEFWIGFLILFVGGILIHAVPLAGQLIWVLSFYCWVCLFSKRLHDMGRSGFTQVWLYVVDVIIVGALLAGGIGGIVIAILSGSGHIGWSILAGSIGLLLLAALVWTLKQLVFAFWVGLSPGQVGDNKYGPDPLR